MAGSISVTEPFGALAASAVTAIAAGAEGLMICVMFPPAAVNTRVPAAAVIGALMEMP